MAKIYVSNLKKSIEVAEDSNLLEILLNNDISIENPCNGKGTCYKCKVKVQSNKTIPISKEEQKALSSDELASGIRLACLCNINKNDEVEVETLAKETKHRVLSSGALPNFKKELRTSGYGLAVDIGTTTVVLTLVDLKSGEQLTSSTRINSQKQYGLDVLTRITYEYNNPESGIKKLQNAIISDLNEMLDEVCMKASVIKNEVDEIDVAANTTMLHMLLGIDARSIGKSPYKPVFIEAQTLKAKDIGLSLSDEAILYCLPSVSSYIGADIVAGTYVCELAKKENTLFIDIGTNGEIVLVSNGKITCCSCAAGPALEGMNISSGMRAADGAIEDIFINEEQISITTIGNSSPQGLCGSGILSAIKELLRVGIVKKSGAFIKKEALAENDYRNKYIRMNENKREFVIREKNDDNIEIIVSMSDVRQVQLAKGALLSGFMALLNKANLMMSDIDKVIVAGQFGSHLSVDILVGTGILPKIVENKVSYVGNSSSAGAYMSLMSKQIKKEIEELANRIEYLELAETEDYERLFTKCLIFPDDVK